MSWGAAKMLVPDPRKAGQARPFPRRDAAESMGALRRVLLTACLALAFCTSARAEEAISARARQAYQALQAGDLPRALRQSEQDVREQRGRSSSWSIRGYVLSHAGEKQESEQAYRKATDLNPADPIARNNLGTVLLELGQIREALEAFEAALALDPRYADASNNRGAALERLGELAAARRAYRVATVMNPRHARAHNNLGAAQLASGNVRAASASFAKAAALDPGFAAPALNLALLDEGATGGAAMLRQLEQAAAQPGASVALRARLHAMRGGMAADAREWEKAREHYLAALLLTPRDTALLNNVGVVEDQLGLDREALLHLTQALDIDPGLRIAQNNIGIVHVHRGQLEAAQELFSTLVKDDPNFHRAHYNLGVIHASQGRIGAARASFRRASRLAPQDAAVRYNLAILNRRDGGNLRAEMRAYDEVLRLNPNLTEAHLALGMLLADPATPAEMRDPARARRHLRQFLKLVAPHDREGRGQAEDWLRFLGP